MKAEWSNTDSLSIESTGQKAFLVLDMPRHCAECQCCYGFICFPLAREMGMWAIHHGKPVDCPLKPMPIKQYTKLAIGTDLVDGFKDGWNYGWNACLEEIEK